MASVTKPLMLDETGQAIATALGNISIRPQIVDNLTTADTTKALSAKQGKVLNDNSTWKLVGDVKGKTAINMPTDWKEAYVLLHYYGSNGSPMPFTFTWNIIKDSLRVGENLYYFRNGFCTSLSAEYGQCAVAYSVSGNYFWIDDAYHNNNDYNLFPYLRLYFLYS